MRPWLFNDKKRALFSSLEPSINTSKFDFLKLLSKQEYYSTAVSQQGSNSKDLINFTYLIHFVIELIPLYDSSTRNWKASYLKIRAMKRLMFVV